MLKDNCTAAEGYLDYGDLIFFSLRLVGVLHSRAGFAVFFGLD